MSAADNYFVIMGTILTLMPFDTLSCHLIQHHATRGLTRGHERHVTVFILRFSQFSVYLKSS